MRRREFIAGLGGTITITWPVVARAQQPAQMRRIGFLYSNFAPDDPEGQARGNAFVQGLQQLGWSVGRNLRIDYRWGLGDPDRLRRAAHKLVALAPDALFAAGTPAVASLHEATSSLPVVFANVTDPMGGGFVDSMARPGGNLTGFMSFEYGQSGKWLELLKRIAPDITRAGVIRTLAGSDGPSQLAAIQAVAPLHGVEIIPVNVRTSAEVERGVTDIARAPNGGLIVITDSWYRDVIIELAARQRLPAVYNSRSSVTVGGLMSYSLDVLELYRRSAGYMDRVLKGEKPADLPVQAPTKYETAINIKTAKALGLTIPETLLAVADEVIQ
jgi:putative tryptophan/tyrosine transport system substrate-binding protein